jgi:hypothetical protein
MDWLFSLYIISSFFGVGVMLIDIVGLLGHHEDGAAHHTGNSNDVSDTIALGDIGHADIGQDDTAYDNIGHGDTEHADIGHHNTESVISHGHEIMKNPHESDSPVSPQELTGQQTGSVAFHDQPAKQITPLLRFLSYLRTLVYFTFGFGPLGWVAWVLAQGAGQTEAQAASNSLCWSLPGGLLFAIGGRLLRRLQRQELDSSVKEGELLLEEAEVIVSIKPGQLGKIRINYSGQYVERYAKASRSDVGYVKESKVRVVDITDEYLVVADE